MCNASLWLRGRISRDVYFQSRAIWPNIWRLRPPTRKVYSIGHRLAEWGLYDLLIKPTGSSGKPFEQRLQNFDDEKYHHIGQHKYRYRPYFYSCPFCVEGNKANNFLVALPNTTTKGPGKISKIAKSQGFPPKKRRTRPGMAQEILTSLRGFRKLNKFRKALAVLFFCSRKCRPIEIEGLDDSTVDDYD